MLNAPPGLQSAVSGMSSTWPQWLLLAVAIGSCAGLTLAGDCSDPLNCPDGQTGEMRARCIRIEPRAVTSCEGLQRGREGGGLGERHGCSPVCSWTF